MIEDDKGYLHGNPEHSDQISRQVAFKEIYQKHRERYPLPFSKYVVHHKDRKKRNNDPDNLDIVTREEHNEIHRLSLYSKKELDKFKALDQSIQRGYISNQRAIPYKTNDKPEETKEDINLKKIIELNKPKAPIRKIIITFIKKSFKYVPLAIISLFLFPVVFGFVCYFISYLLALIIMIVLYVLGFLFSFNAKDFMLHNHLLVSLSGIMKTIIDVWVPYSFLFVYTSNTRPTAVMIAVILGLIVALRASIRKHR